MRAELVENQRRAPTQKRSKETVKAILQATARILVAEGIEAASTNRIAKDAGVSIGSLYQYFDSREAIVAALAQEHADEMLAMLAQHVASIGDASVEDAVRTYVVALVKSHQTDPELHVALIHQLLRSGPAALKAIQDPARGLVRAWLERHARAVRPRDLDAAAFLLTTTAEAAIHAQILEDPRRLHDAAWQRELVDLLLRYLLP